MYLGHETFPLKRSWAGNEFVHGLWCIPVDSTVTSNWEETSAYPQYHSTVLRKYMGRFCRELLSVPGSNMLDRPGGRRFN
jgi:hypothetical protein